MYYKPVWRITLICCALVLFWAYGALADESPTFPAGVKLASLKADTSEQNVVLAWEAVPGAQSYGIWVNDSRGIAFKKWYKAADCRCDSGTGQCTVTLPNRFVQGVCRWWVQTWSNSLAGKWSRGGSFTVSESTALAQAPAATWAAPAGGSASASANPSYAWEMGPNSSARYRWMSGSSTGMDGGPGEGRVQLSGNLPLMNSLRFR